jgi:hypothetical protein
LRFTSALLIAASLGTVTAFAQQRPLDTDDPEPVGTARVLVAGGISYAHDRFYPLSGLEGNLWQLPVFRFVVGIGPIADFELNGGPYDRMDITARTGGPLAGLVTASGDTTHAVDDIMIGTKIRLVPETTLNPAIGFRFAVRLPNAKHESGLGQDTTDFSASALVGKTIHGLRIVANAGITIMSEPLDAAKQNDVIAYGFSAVQPISPRIQLVGEITGRWSTRQGVAPIGTESSGNIKAGARYRKGAVQLDAALFAGLEPVDPSFGVTAGFTYVFQGF